MNCYHRRRQLVIDLAHETNYQLHCPDCGLVGTISPTGMEAWRTWLRAIRMEIDLRS